MASHISLCDICKLRHLSNPSTHWCQDCDETLCLDCKEYHTLLKATRGHKTIPITDYEKIPAFITSIKKHCNIHKEKYQNYCQKHECPICYKCIQDHAKCTDIIPLEMVIKHSKMSPIFNELNQKVLDLERKFKQMRKGREDNLAKLPAQYKLAVKTIKKFKIKVNRHLDSIEQTLMTELLDAKSKCKQQTEEMLKRLNEIELEILSFKTTLNGTKEHEPELQDFWTMTEIGKQVSAKEKHINTMTENKHFDDFTVSVEMDTKLENILSDVKMFGKVIIERVPTNEYTSMINTESRQAQIFTNVVRYFDDIKLRQIKVFDSECKCITGCAILPDGRMALTEYGKGILTMRKEDGTSDVEFLLIGSNSFDVTVVDVETVAVSSGQPDSTQEACIQIIKLDSIERNKIINTDSKCYGLVEVDGDLIFCGHGYGPDGVQTIDLKSDPKSVTIRAIFLGTWSYIAYFNKKFYVTEDIKNTITCCDNQGKVIWTYKDDINMIKPRGISVDNNGNVFVACERSNNVSVISPDGTRAKQIVDSKDGLDGPRALHYDNFRNSLLVVDSKGIAYVFNMQ